MATKKTGPGGGIMQYAPKAKTAKVVKKTTTTPAGKTNTATGGKKTTTAYVGKPTTSTTGGGKKATTTTTTTTRTATPASTDPNRYFVGEKRGTSPTQEVNYGQYMKARTNPAMATVKINKADTAKINNLSRNYGANSVKGYVKKKV